VSDRAPIEVSSRATRVIFFEDRAEVHRRARCTLERGVSSVAVRGVTAMVDDPTVLVRITDGPGRVLATRVLRRVRQEPEADGAQIRLLETDRDRARARRVAAERALERATAEESRAIRLFESWVEAAGRVPRANEADGDARLLEWGAAERRIDSAWTVALDRTAKTREELEQAKIDEARADGALNLGRLVKPRFETAVEAQLEIPGADAAHAVELELTYRTPCALWRPEHLARLEPRPSAGPGSQVVIKSFATVWQQTGELWQDVACRFSTARPAQSASPPLIGDDVLVSRKKSAEEKKTVLVEARDQAIALAGLGRGVRAVEEMPGVEDGGEPLWFEAPRPVTIASDGHPFRVEIGELVLPCTVDRIATPEIGEAAHIRATATLSSAVPLLAGPVWVARGTELVGRNRTAFVARGEPFELGFGSDDGIRVRRKIEEKRETVPVLGTQKVARTVTLFLSNLSGTARELTVSERFPVSEIGEVQVAVTSSGGARIDAKDGFARFEVDLPPRGTKRLTFAYRIEAAAKVVLPF
jgi:uncharacterized protein (TIGR02231 family)